MKTADIDVNLDDSNTECKSPSPLKRLQDDSELSPQLNEINSRNGEEENAEEKKKRRMMWTCRIGLAVIILLVPTILVLLANTNYWGCPIDSVEGPDFEEFMTLVGH